MRSRTGCLTCRARKLKCDERRPQCQNCHRAKRECRPSDGIVFRHQQNASMNGIDGGTAPEGNLHGFYSYKNTFSPDSVWLEIPKKVTFVDVTDPYAEESEESTFSPANVALPGSQRAEWGPDARCGSRASEVAAHGLEALSAAASRDQCALTPSQASHHDMASTAISYMAQNLPRSPTLPNSARKQTQVPSSPTPSVASVNNINFLLNPQNPDSPPIDPNLKNPSERKGPLPARTENGSEPKGDQREEADQEVAYLLRHFPEAPGAC